MELEMPPGAISRRFPETYQIRITSLPLGHRARESTVSRPHRRLFRVRRSNFYLLLDKSKVKWPYTITSKLRSIVSRRKPSLTTLEYDFTPPLDNASDDDAHFSPGESTNTVEQEVVTDDLPPLSRATRTSIRMKQSTNEFLQSIAQQDLEFNNFRGK